MGGTTLRVGRDGAVATLTLNRPEKLNSLNEAMDRELREALGGIEGGDAAVRAVLPDHRRRQGLLHRAGPRRRRARALALLGEPVSAEQAEAWGLI